MDKRQFNKGKNLFSFNKQEESPKVHCPFDPSHLVPQESLEKHKKKCQLRSLKITPDEFDKLPSSSFFYEGKNGVVCLNPVLEEIPTPIEDIFPNLFFPETFKQIKPEMTSSEPKKSNQTAEFITFNDSPSSILDNELVIPYLSYEKTKQFIFGLRKIPTSLASIPDWRMVDYNRVMMYIARAIPKYSNAFEDPQAVHYLYALFIQNNPDAVVQLLFPKIGDKTPEFVVEVWKNVLLDILDMRYNFMRQTGKSVNTIDEIETQSEVNNNVSKGRLSLLSSKERRNQFLHDNLVSRKLRKTMPPLSSLELAYFPKYMQDQQTKPKSQLELLQEQRDYKRRRQKYRAKNVHITKRTPKDVARGLVSSIMADVAIENGLKPSQLGVEGRDEDPNMNEQTQQNENNYNQRTDDRDRRNFKGNQQQDYNRKQFYNRNQGSNNYPNNQNYQRNQSFQQYPPQPFMNQYPHQ